MAVVDAQPAIRIREVGSVRAVKKNIARIGGLSNFMNGQLVTFAGGIRGLVAGFQETDILAFILGDEAGVRIGQEVYSSQDEFKIPVGEGFLNRIVTALAEPADGKGPVPYSERYPVFRDAPETMDRGASTGSLETGTKIIDAIVPFCKGQRQLIMGDRMTGKTTIAVDAIVNQKGRDVVCIYCCIGKSTSSLLKTIHLLKTKGALAYTLIVAAPACSTAGEQYLAPYSACALGEYFMHRGKDVLVVFDDLTKHAWSYRQLSLLLERPSGREAYPGDIYYIHSQLIERGGKLSAELGGGSMTFIALAETLHGDITGFISSNLVSMTDGQIYLSPFLSASGLKPAVDFSLSVSIIGSRTQHPVLKRLAGSIRMEYAQYKELRRLTKLKSSLNTEAEAKLWHGEVMSALLSQDKNNPVSVAELIVLLYGLQTKLLDGFDIARIKTMSTELRAYILNNHAGLVGVLNAALELTPELRMELDGVFKGYFGGSR